MLLFDRRGYRARLTPAGEELLREGRHLLAAADELARRVRRVASGWEQELTHRARQRHSVCTAGAAARGISGGRADAAQDHRRSARRYLGRAALGARRPRDRRDAGRPGAVTPRHRLPLGADRHGELRVCGGADPPTGRDRLATADERTAQAPADRCRRHLAAAGAACRRPARPGRCADRADAGGKDRGAEGGARLRVPAGPPGPRRDSRAAN